MERAILLFDEGCGFCRRSTELILRWDRAGRILAVPLQNAEADRLLATLDPAVRMASWHLVDHGRVWSAGAAVPILLRLLPAGAPLAALTETFPGATQAAYRYVARHRERLSRWLGERA